MGMRMLGVALAAIALGAAVVAPASAAGGNDVVEIRSTAHGQCLQAGEELHGRALIVACDGEADQRWEAVPVDGGTHLLRNLGNRSCLSAEFTTYYCDAQAVHEFTSFVPDTSGSVRVKLGEGEQYLTVFTWQSGEREAMVQGLRDSDEQRWQVRTVGTAAPLPDTSGQVVRLRAVEHDTYGCISLTGGTKVTTAPCADTPEQRFQRIELADGRTALRSVVTDKCVAPRQDQSTGLAAVLDCATDDVRQHWSFERTGTGAVLIRQSTGDRVITPSVGWLLLLPRQYDPWQHWDLLPA
ncbi:RICIN domain-containing protein [Lentzea albida]|uniref:Cytolethal distending toxin A/C domain-containing protein n=1 Tax=Lentzea albida TaxID=65499 RepID=A0A1H9LLN6_9PSEU|nr:hypothetical protein [Lentzea albida]SER12346.1 Cytolethal distending toxin A/C domain-containing protein [Lentzea albida]